MYRDPSEFRERFLAYKNGKSVREIYGLPGYAEGAVGADPELDMIKKYEGWRDKTYLDSKGIPTIGWGFTDSSLISKGRMSRREGDIYLSKRVEKRKAYLRNKLGPLIWDKLDTATKSAFLSYDHNYPAGFGDDTRFMRHWRAGRYNDAVSEMNAGMNDESSPGLRTRRLDELATVRKDSFLFPRVKSQKPEDALIQKSDVTRTVTIPTALQLIISRVDRRNTVGAEIDRTIWANKVMHDIQGMAYDIPVWESPSLPALTPVEYDVTPLKTYSSGKLPGYHEGELPMGEKRLLSDEEVKLVALNAPHEQGMSGEDPLMSMLVGMKAVRLVGDLLALRRLKEKAEMYKRWREANELTRDASRAWKMLDADRMARNWGYSDNPLGFLYDIFLDPVANMYTKIQKHPILGPLIPFSDGKLPGYSNGKIRIKPSKRGTFTAAAKKHGASVREFESRVLKNPEKYSKAMVKKARFSRNARSWKH